MIIDSLKTAVLFLLVAVLQLTLANPLELLDGPPSLLLVVLVALALLRGPALGAVAGFWAGLIIDTATLDTLGLTSLVLVLVGYSVGWFGEVTTARRRQLPRVVIATVIATSVFMAGSILVNTMLDTSVPLGPVLARTFLPMLALNVVLAYPVFLLVRLVYPLRLRQRPEAVPVA